MPEFVSGVVSHWQESGQYRRSLACCCSPPAPSCQTLPRPIPACCWRSGGCWLPSCSSAAASRGVSRLTDAEWTEFAARTITPNFPDGFTVFDGDGQWRNPQTGHIAGPHQNPGYRGQARTRSRAAAGGGDRRLQDRVSPAIGWHHHPRLVRRVLAGLRDSRPNHSHRARGQSEPVLGAGMAVKDSCLGAGTAVRNQATGDVGDLRGHHGTRPPNLRFTVSERARQYRRPCQRPARHPAIFLARPGR